eukprot:gb/GECG01015609.1/.p1 GENE.gb/GECG01015609.1/~~gb/GECG01015609.1/.p1  ORF type:complete len:336 (+),score=27.69 gb/GECG01015609.1/:1-1008(+)
MDLCDENCRAHAMLNLVNPQLPETRGSWTKILQNPMQCHLNSSRALSKSSFSTDMHLHPPYAKAKRMDRMVSDFLQDSGKYSLTSRSEFLSEPMESAPDVSPCVGDPIIPVLAKQIPVSERKVTATGKRSRPAAVKGSNRQESEMILPSTIKANFCSIKQKILEGQRIPEEQIDELMYQCSSFELLDSDESPGTYERSPMVPCTVPTKDKRRQLGALRARRSRQKRKRKLAFMEKVANELADLLSKAVTRLSSHTPLDSQCLVQRGMNSTNLSSNFRKSGHIISRNALSYFSLHKHKDFRGNDQLSTRGEPMESEESAVATVLSRMHQGSRTVYR